MGLAAVKMAQFDQHSSELRRWKGFLRHPWGGLQGRWLLVSGM